MKNSNLKKSIDAAAKKAGISSGAMASRLYILRKKNGSAVTYTAKQIHDLTERAAKNYLAKKAATGSGLSKAEQSIALNELDKIEKSQPMMNGFQLAAVKAGLDPMTPGLENMTFQQMQNIASKQQFRQVQVQAAAQGIVLTDDGTTYRPDNRFACQSVTGRKVFPQ